MLVLHVPHASKPALRAPALVRLLTTAGGERAFIFAGAELAGDALGLAGTEDRLRLHRGLDFTPLYSDLALHASGGWDTAGLRTIVERVVCGGSAASTGPPAAGEPPLWVKDRAVTCSEWGTHRLTLPQVKYAALDAWASARVGCHALTRRLGAGGRMPAPAALDAVLFTVVTVPSEVLALLSDLLQNAEALKEAQKKHHEVTLEGVEYTSANDRQVTLRMRVRCAAGGGRVGWGGGASPTLSPVCCPPSSLTHLRPPLHAHSPPTPTPRRRTMTAACGRGGPSPSSCPRGPPWHW